MSTSPVSKQSIRHAVGAVLKEHGITDELLAPAQICTLQIEGAIATALWGFYQRLASGENPQLVQADMLDSFMSQHAELKYRAALVERINKVLKLNSQTGNKWDRAFRFIERMERENKQTIEQFAEWCRNDPYNAPKRHHIANNPDLIRINWPGAFTNSETQLSFERQGHTGGLDF